MKTKKAVTPEKEEKTTEKKKPTLKSVKIEKLRPFENHPYKILDDEAMEELKASISDMGLLNRIIIRPLGKTDDEYEIISGHRRVHAAKALGMKGFPLLFISLTVMKQRF